MATMSSIETDDITWSGDDIFTEDNIENDADLQQMAAKFQDDITIIPDTDLNVDPSDSVPADSDSSNAGSIRENEESLDTIEDNGEPKLLLQNGVDQQPLTNNIHTNGTVTRSQKIPQNQAKSFKQRKETTEKLKDTSDTASVSGKNGCLPTRKNPLKMLKKLTKFDKSSKKSDFRSQFSVVAVDRLPQVFVVKYLGHREVSGVSGLHHVRKPVDEMVTQMKTKLDSKDELGLPLLYVVVSSKGFDLREHQSNKVKGQAPLGVLPVNLISYGVQDLKYWRVFTCIVVRALSWQKKSATCHAFLCDSSISCRRMALALGAAFKISAQNLQESGRSNNFKVELRPPDELAEELHEFEA